MKLMIIERSDYFRAMTLLHNAPSICTAGSLWVELWLVEGQVEALKNANISCRRRR